MTFFAELLQRLLQKLRGKPILIVRDIVTTTIQRGPNGWAASIQEALDDIPEAVRLDNTEMLVNGGTLCFDTDIIDLDATLVISGKKNITFRFAGEAHGQVTFRMNSVAGTDVAMTFTSGFGSFAAAGVTLDRCRIVFEQDSRSTKIFTNWSFHRTLAPALQTVGTGVVNVDMFQPNFRECMGGIKVTHTGCDYWNLHEAKFTRMNGVGIHYDSSELKMWGGSFENKFDAAASDFPDIKINFGHVIFDGVRFGNEGNSAKIRVQLGPDVPSTGTIPNVVFRDCKFLTTYPNQQHVFRLTKGLSESKLDNFYRRHDGAIVLEDNLTASRNSIWSGVRLVDSHTDGEFSGGSLPPGWSI